MVSVIIPAHNEEAVLPACLRSLLRQDLSGSMRVIVVTNGCTDKTADVARSWQAEAIRKRHDLHVVEIDEASNPAALNAGDALAGGDVRVYLDADVELSVNAISAVGEILQKSTSIHLCAPKTEVIGARSRMSRSFARIWTQLPYAKEGVLGCGFYAVSAEGRRRWGQFPPLLSEDMFVQFNFSPEECKIAENATFKVHLPEGLIQLARVRSRYYRGNRQLRLRFPNLYDRGKRRFGNKLRAIASNPRLWLHLPQYTVVYGLAQWLTYRDRGANIEKWQRADRSWAKPSSSHVETN